MMSLLARRSCKSVHRLEGLGNLERRIVEPNDGKMGGVLSYKILAVLAFG